MGRPSAKRYSNNARYAVRDENEGDPYVAAYDGTAALSRHKELAYDLARFDRRTAVRRAYEEQAFPARQAVRRKAAAKPGLFTRVSAFAVFSFFIVTALMLLIVYSYVQLSELSAQATDLKGQYHQLKSDEAKMTLSAEQRMSLDDIEEYAVNKLGMIKPEQDQVFYLDLSGSDYAEIVDESQQGKSTFLGGLSKMLGLIVTFIN